MPVYFPTATRLKPTAHVLINGIGTDSSVESQPFLSWQYVGLGRAISVAAPVTYQLRFRRGDRLHHRFWGQLLRWAIARDMNQGSKTVRIASDKASYEQGDQAQIIVHLTDPNGNVFSGALIEVEASQGDQWIKSVQLDEDKSAPGQYRGLIDDLPVGQVKFRPLGSSVDSLLAMEDDHKSVELVVSVDPSGTREFSRPFCNLPLLAQLAEATGGAVLTPGSVPKALARADYTGQTEMKVINRRPIWNPWGCLWVFASCICLEWWIRKLKRMS